MLLEKELVNEDFNLLIENNKIEIEKLTLENLELRQELNTLQRYSIINFYFEKKLFYSYLFYLIGNF